MQNPETIITIFCHCCHLVINPRGLILLFDRFEKTSAMTTENCKIQVSPLHLFPSITMPEKNTCKSVEE